MFKRSLASVAAVAIASGAVVAPANAVTVKVSYDGSCTFFLTAEETRLTNLNQIATLKKKEATYHIVEGQLLGLRAQIEKDQKELAKLGPDAEAQKKDLMSKLEENKKKLTAYENFKHALDACIADRNYDSDQPEGQGKPGGTDQSGDSKNPGVNPAPPSNDGAGIGAIFAASIAAILGILAAALPFIKSILPPQLRALLP
ncbi:hypothetical protein CIP107582_02053 [Corynebacterium diphtheriae]|nr:hypothetical protein CIP107582_02053 [Corynebacterium diphtheriae]